MIPSPQEEKAPSRTRLFYEVSEAAEVLECSAKSVYRYIKQEKIPCVKGVGRIKLSRARVDQLARLMLEGKVG